MRTCYTKFTGSSSSIGKCGGAGYVYVSTKNKPTRKKEFRVCVHIEPDRHTLFSIAVFCPIRVGLKCIDPMYNTYLRQISPSHTPWSPRNNIRPVRSLVCTQQHPTERTGTNKRAATMNQQRRRKSCASFRRPSSKKRAPSTRRRPPWRSSTRPWPSPPWLQTSASSGRRYASICGNNRYFALPPQAKGSTATKKKALSFCSSLFRFCRLPHWPHPPLRLA